MEAHQDARNVLQQPIALKKVATRYHRAYPVLQGFMAKIIVGAASDATCAPLADFKI
jgi:hypothetical protein